MNYDCVDVNGGQASSFGQSAGRMFGMPRGFDPNKKEVHHPASHDEASANPHANKHTRKDLISVSDECSLTHSFPVKVETSLRLRVGVPCRIVLISIGCVYFRFLM